MSVSHVISLACPSPVDNTELIRPFTFSQYANATQPVTIYVRATVFCVPMADSYFRAWFQEDQVSSLILPMEHPNLYGPQPTYRRAPQCYFT